MKTAAGNDRRGGMRADTVIRNCGAISYLYCHSRRGTLGITVRPGGSVTVRAPLRTPLHTIRDFVAGRAAWIAKVREKFSGQSAVQPQSYEEGAIFLFRGAEYRLAVEQGASASVRLRGDSLVVSMPDNPALLRHAKLLDNWYLERALEIFGERLAACHCRMPPGTPLPPLVIRSMKSRWGSYSCRTRRITLNLNLVKLPQECLDYVIIHELCHISEHHHGPGFWRLVGQYCPDYAKARGQLRNSVL